MKLADISIKRPVFATVMIAVLVVFGLASYPKIGVDLFPNIDFPIVTVTSVYPGADPETIESKVLDPIEEAVSTVTGIKTLRSTALENVGFVMIQFQLERDSDQALADVRDKVSAVLGRLPSDLEPPIVEKLDLGAAPVMALTVSGGMDTRALTDIADNRVKQRLQSISGVGGIDIVGGQDREIHIWIDPNKLSGFGLTITDVVQALGAQNVEIPGGRIELDGTERVIKTLGKVRTVEELEDLIITAAAGAPVRVRDVARVEDGVEELRSSSSVNGVQAVSLVVRKQSGANTVAVAHSVKLAVEELAKTLPEGVKLNIQTDNSAFITQSIDDVQFDLAFGALLAVLIIMFFLHDWRATLISALALPTSVIATFAFINVMGFTFNIITMLALSLSIGILIDDAIVVIENIHRHLAMGKPALKAAADGTAEIGLAVVATTASIIAVFVPVATMKGMIGRFFFQFGLTVAFAVAVSLFVAFTLTPMLSSRMLVVHTKRKFILSRMIDKGLDGITYVYRGIARRALRFRVSTIVLATAILVGSFYLGSLIPFEFMPQEDRGEFKVSVELPIGTPLAATSKYVDEVAQQIRDTPGFASTFVTIGGGKQGEVQKANIQVTMVPRDERGFSQKEGMEYIRSLVSDRTDAKFAVEPLSPVGGDSGMRSSLVQFNLRGSNYDELNDAADKVIAKLKEVGGYVDLDKTYRGGKPEMQVSIDRDAAADLGIPIALIAMTVRTMFEGQKATELSMGGESFDVNVKLADQYRQSSGALKSFEMRGKSGMLVDLASLVTVKPGFGESTIDRQNRQRQVTILANLEGKVLGEAVEEIDKIAADVVPKTLTTDWTGMSEMMKESVQAMIEALLLAIILIYLILAAQFESFVHPLTIMMSLPLSLVGALGALVAAGMTMSIFTMIGFIMLMGLVTKNAILLVDYALHLQNEGMDIKESLVQAGSVRLRPILMTTAAMIFGMLPVALALSEGGEQRAPMAVAVIGGLITSTVLTLVVVPVVFSLLDSIGAGVRWVFGMKKQRAKEEGFEVEASSSPHPEEV